LEQACVTWALAWARHLRGLRYWCLARGCTNARWQKTFLLKLHRYMDTQGRKVLSPESAALSGYLA